MISLLIIYEPFPASEYRRESLRPFANHCTGMRSATDTQNTAIAIGSIAINGLVERKLFSLSPANFIKSRDHHIRLIISAFRFSWSDTKTDHYMSFSVARRVHFILPNCSQHDFIDTVFLITSVDVTIEDHCLSNGLAVRSVCDRRQHITPTRAFIISLTLIVDLMNKWTPWHAISPSIISWFVDNIIV